MLSASKTIMDPTIFLSGLSYVSGEIMAPPIPVFAP
jgi:hypothetical protein